MQNAQAMYAQGIDQLVSLLKGLGTKRSVLIEGDMGIGKSTLLKILKRDLPDHHAAYFDCTTKDLGDLMLPRIAVRCFEVPYASLFTPITRPLIGRPELRLGRGSSNS